MVGINHETAPVELRERLAFSAAECERTLKAFIEMPSVSEAVLLSTCNRTELYARQSERAPEAPAQLAQALVSQLIRCKQAKSLDAGLFSIRYDQDAIRHLYRVAAGLESMIKGEAQILGQVKDAYRTACNASTCRLFMHKLLHTAFRVGKRARAKTAIGVGAVSVSLAAVELAERVFGDLSGKQALVVGAGEMAELAAVQFADRGADLTLANRTESKARELADKLGGRIAPFEPLAEAVAETDLVFASTAASHFVITEAMLRPIMPVRRRGDLLLIDLAVPRNIDPAIRSLDGVCLYDIDDLRAAVDRNLAQRRTEIPKVERIVEKELAAFERWYKTHEIAPTIKDLVASIESLRQGEIERVAKYFSAEQLERIDQLTRRLVKKVLHHPITRLKDSLDHDEDGTP